MSTTDTRSTRLLHIDRLRQQLDQLTDQSPPPDQLANRLAELEHGLMQWRAQQSADDDAHGNDVFRHVAAARRWQAICREHALTDAVNEADALVHRLLDRAAQQWRDKAMADCDTDQPHVCFDWLVHTSRLQLAAAHWETTAHAERFDATRTTLRESLAQTVERETLDETTRQQWVKTLADQADHVLAEIDELEPAQASAKLAIARDDLQWHIAHVEPARGPLRGRLRRKVKRLRAEQQERSLQNRLESTFGARVVAGSERLVLILIGVVLGLMVLEWSFTWSRTTIITFHIIDTVACAFFLIEFGTKLWFVDEKRFWFRRHWLIDLLPSIPIGLITIGLGGVGGGDAVRWGRAARFFRLPRLVRYVRLLRPALRLLRGFGLLARGLDRLVPRYAALLNRNIILYPTKDELNRAEDAATDSTSDVNRLRVDLQQQWRDALETASRGERAHVAQQRLHALSAAAESATVTPPTAIEMPAPTAREMPAGPLLQRLGGLQSTEVEAALDEELIEQLSRVIRLMARRPVRWLPIIHSFVPRVTSEMSDAQVVARAARRAAGTLKWWHNLWFWFADLYGTVTPSQFVDRVGSILVNSSFRPAYRLVMFGGALLLVQLGLTLTTIDALTPVENFLRNFVGPTILVLGSVALLVLALGWWMKRLAREATEFYERSAEAQFVSLTEVIRTRHVARDAAILRDRVLCDENDEHDDSTNERNAQIEHLTARLRDALASTHQAPTNGTTSDALERLVLLSRDWLDGAMFTASDTRSTTQLLGNPAVDQLLRHAHRIDRKQQKALSRLDLRRQGSVLGGPYLWFNFISRACTHSVARLLVEYNRNAISLRALPRYSTEAQAQFERWRDRTATAEESEQAAADNATGGNARADYVTTAFTALHFLDFDPRRDEKIKARFGEKVLQRMQQDRRVMIRRIFGTYPMHDQPKGQRVVNPYAFYQGWLAGGRALFLPLYVLGLMWRGTRTFVRWVARSVQEIRHPERRSHRISAASADFRTAVRKINRVRLPVVLECIRLRGAIDPDYLGTPLYDAHARIHAPAPVEADRRFLDLDVTAAEQIKEQQQRGRADMHRLRRLIDAGLMEKAAKALDLPADSFGERVHYRAIATAYLSDYRGVRSRLSAHAVILEAARRLAADALPPTSSRPRPFLKRRFRRFWDAHGDDSERHRKAAWYAVRNNWWGAADALRAWHALGEQTEEEGVRLLGELLQHAEQLCEQLMTLRCVQTLAVLDVLHYREHVYRLGGYEADDDPASMLLHWRSTREAEAAALSSME